MSHIALGQYNRLQVVKEVDFGMYLDGGDDGEILLPSRYVPEDCRVGQELEVFVYLDMDERLVATTLHPHATVGQFAWLRVAWVNQHGAFLDWGLMKDLFVPFREQRQKMQQGHSYMVYIYIDDESYRIAASAKVEKFLSKEMPPYKRGSRVDIIVWQPAEQGYRVIVDNRYAGMLYRNQLFTPVAPGMKLQAYVRRVRTDGKLDLELQPDGMERIEEFAPTLLEHLRQQGGHIDLHDGSDAAAIYAAFGVSKKTFKRAVGQLYRQRLIVLEPDGIRLAD